MSIRDQQGTREDGGHRAAWRGDLVGELARQSTALLWTDERLMMYQCTGFPNGSLPRFPFLGIGRDLVETEP
jgi:hypothetical protein